MTDETKEQLVDWMIHVRLKKSEYLNYWIAYEDLSADKLNEVPINDMYEKYLRWCEFTGADTIGKSKIYDMDDFINIMCDAFCMHIVGNDDLVSSWRFVKGRVLCKDAMTEYMQEVQARRRAHDGRTESMGEADNR